MIPQDLARGEVLERLIRREGSKATLYLDDTEVQLNTSRGARDLDSVLHQCRQAVRPLGWVVLQNGLFPDEGVVGLGASVPG